MLLDDLYSINEVQILENGTLQAKININSEHSIFSGHFPGQPITPGVCLTNMITDTISIYHKKSYYLLNADFIKFIQLVDPKQILELKTHIKTISSENDLLKVEAVLFHENSTFLKLKGHFKTKNQLIV